MPVVGKTRVRELLQSINPPYVVLILIDVPGPHWQLRADLATANAAKSDDPVRLLNWRGLAAHRRILLANTAVSLGPAASGINQNANEETLSVKHTTRLAGAAALAAFASAATAQSGVSISGLMDLGVQRVKTFDGVATTRQSGGGFQTSRLRFTGNEDLGGGNKAQFYLEMRLNPDTGAADNLGAFSRASWVGISGDDWGALRFGRQNAPSGPVICAIDLHWCGSGFNASGIFYNGTNQAGRWIVPNAGRGGNGNQGVSVYSGGTGVAGTADSARINNSIVYESRRFGGVQGTLMYALGEAGASPANGNGNHVGGSLTYASGPLYLAAAFESVAADPLWNAKGRVVMFGGTYRFGSLRVGGIVQRESASGPAARWTSANAWALTSAYRVGAFEPYLKVGAHRTNGTGSYGIVNGTDAKMLNFGTVYDLSKRTRLYVDFAKDFAGSDGAGANRVDPTQLQFGLQHSF